CLVMAWQVQGRRVRTIESVAADAASAPVRDALARCGGVQCGYCSAGMVMTLSYLHAQSPRPSGPEAATQMCGNLCRCTGYGGLSRAIVDLFPGQA
ncbi:MAG: xanthine dehydrogenase subunit E, partial [Comamonadaceae bacterium]